MYIQGVDNVFDLEFNDRRASPTATCSSRTSSEMSTYNFEVARHRRAVRAVHEGRGRVRALPGRAKLPIPAYEQAIKASHVFNTLQARGVISGRRAPGLHRPRPRPREGRCGAWVAHTSRERLSHERDFLLELLSEEIPARMQAKARNDLARLFAECTEAAGLKTRCNRRLRDAAAAGADRAGVAGRHRGEPRRSEGPAHLGAAAGARGLPAQDRPDARTSSRSATASISR